MRFEFTAGALCLDFANTIHDSRAEDNTDELRAIGDLLQWAKEAGLVSVADHERLATLYARNSREAAAALAAGIATRDLMLRIFGGPANGRPVSSARLSELNAALGHTAGRPRVHRHAGRTEMQWESVSDGLERILFAVLTSAAQLLASDRVGRIRECASADCTWLFVDETRNHSRRWCDMSSCGNRMKARRHYERSKAAQPQRK